MLGSGIRVNFMSRSIDFTIFHLISAFESLYERPESCCAEASEPSLPPGGHGDVGI